MQRGAQVPLDEDLALALDRIKLPNRASAEPEDGSAYGIPTKVTLNVFKLHMENAPGKIFKYDLQFFVKRKNGKEFELNNALIRVPEFVLTKKRNALVALLRLAHEHDKEFFRMQQIGKEENEFNYWRSCCAFDCGSSYYTAVDLPDQSGEIPEVNWKESNWITTYIPSSSGCIRWELKKVEEFRIDVENAKSPQALNFFSVLAMQNLQRQDEIDVKRDAAYMQGGDQTRDLKELRKGIVTAGRTVGEDVCIQMDSKISMFFQGMELLEYIKRFSGKHSAADLRAYLLSPHDSMKLRKELKNLPLRMIHLASRRVFECKGLDEQSASQMTFMLRDDSEERLITIADYFLERYQKRLKYPDLPLILEKKQGGQESFHPIECLAIAEGVRVSNHKMSREAQESMITKSCRAPTALAKDLETSRDIAGLDIKNKYLNAFQVRIKDGFPELTAKILSKPFITGMAGIRPDINERGQINFNKPNFKFADPAKPDKPIYFISIDNALDKAQIEQVKSSLLSGATGLGMKIQFSGSSDARMIGGQTEMLKRLMMSESGRTSMFFFVTPEKIDENHYIVKKIEQELGVVTQLIWAKTALDLNKPVTRFNVVAKMNMKLGGVVANPEVPPALKAKDPAAYARAVADWFPNRMFIGLSLSHAGAQSYADRVTGEEVREPTCVGMAFTLRQTGKRTGVSWFIEKRKPIIDDLTRHFIHALDVYAESNNGKMPTSIMIFRKGMSEGELKKAAYEMKQVSEAIRQISTERPELKDYRPTIQCVVCMANTSDRILYVDTGFDNVPAGTVVEKEATNPERLEFIIVAHNAIKGTAKPVKCTLVSEMKGRVGRKLTLSEIESIYNTLCYLNGIAASPTRLPVPLSDSEKAAERQMNNFKEAMRSGEEGFIASIIRDGGEENYRRLSNHFAHKFRSCQYYA